MVIKYHIMHIMSIIILKYFLRSFISNNKKVLKMIFHSSSRPNFYRYIRKQTLAGAERYVTDELIRRIWKI